MPGVSYPGATPASGRVTPAAFPFYTSGEDNLRLYTWNALPGVVLGVNARVVDSQGRASPQVWTHTPNGDRSISFSDFVLSGTTLLNVQIANVQGTPIMGQCFALLMLIRGLGNAATILGPIASGYVASGRVIGWPGSALESPLDGGGYYRMIAGAMPAAGQEVKETCPAGARWELLGVNLTIALAAAVTETGVLWINVSGRVPVFANIWGPIAGPKTINTSVFHTTPSIGWTLAGGIVQAQFPLPRPSVLRAGDFFQTRTDNLQPGDQYQAPTYIVREWLEP